MLPLKTDSSVPVFIVHWNRPWECIRTVECFLAQDDLPLKVSVVDNASDLSQFQILRDRLPPNVELVRLDENKGWGGGLNVLLRQWLKTQAGAYCFVSAHDALPQDKCLNMLLESMQSDPKIGIVSPEYGMGQLPQFSPMRGPRLVTITPRPHGTTESVDFPHGTLMLLSRQCLEKIGLFDERYFAYGDEYDLGLRARRYGWKVAIAWGAIVVNPGSWTPSPMLSYLSARSTLLLASTYGGWGHAIGRSLLMLLNTLRILLLQLPEAQGVAFAPTARLLAIRDFFLGCYGSPPPLSPKK